jgi:hypothetical protein
MNVKDILAFVLARVGLNVEVKSQSPIMTSYFPDFAINPGVSGDNVIDRLLSFVPDVIFIEGEGAYLLNPQSADTSVYSYGQGHVILEGRYRSGAWELNRIQVEGEQGLAVNTFSWSQVDRFYDRLVRIEDRNIGTASEAQQRGEACLREAEIESAGGTILVPVNCGQQLYDVIDVTDDRAGLNAAKRRVLGLVLVYQRTKSQYVNRLELGVV